jgi:putative toxin-antitoxin system antitoxin component (TIGR02293 family)
VGGGIAGLTLALAVHQRSLRGRVYVSAAAVKGLGVGGTLRPHAMGETTSALPGMPSGSKIPARRLTMVTVALVAETLGGYKVLRQRAPSAETLRSRVRNGLPYASLEALMTRYALTIEEASRVLRLPSRTLARRKKAGRLNAEESDRLFRVGRTAAHAEKVFGERAKASRWLHKPNRALGGVSPLSLLDTDLGTREVEQILGRIEHGVYS